MALPSAAPSRARVACVARLVVRTRIASQHATRPFSSSQSRQTAVSRYPPTSSSELDDLLETFRQRVVLPAALRPVQRRSLFRPSVADRLRRDPIVLEIDGERTTLGSIPPFGPDAKPSPRRTLLQAARLMQTREDWRLVLRHLLDGFEYAGEKLSAETIAALIEEAGRKGVVDEVVRAAERGGGWGGRYRVLRMDSQEKVVGITYWLVRSVMDRGWDGPAPLAHSSIQSAAAPAAGEAEGPASHGNTESEGQQQQPDHRTLLGWGLAQTRRVADLVELPSHAPPKGAPRPWKPLSRDPLVLAGPLHMAAVGMLVHGGGGHQAAAEFRQWLEYYAAKLVRAWLPPSSSSAGNEVARGGGIRGQYPEALFARHGELEYLDVAANPGRFVRYAATFLHAIDAASRCVADDKVRARIADEIRPHVRDEVLEALEIVANGEGRGSADGTGKGKVAAGWTIGPRTFVSFFGPDSLHHRLTGGDSPECRAAGELIAKMPPLPVAEAK